MSTKFSTFVSALTGSPSLEEEAVSSLNSPYDAFALAVHVWATKQGLTLIAVNDEDCPSSSSSIDDDEHPSLPVPLNQTRWTKTAPHYYGLRYTAKSPSQHKLATLDLTITKLGQRDVQVSVSGDVVAHTPENSDTSEKNNEDEIKSKFSFFLQNTKTQEKKKKSNPGDDYCDDDDEWVTVTPEPDWIDLSQQYLKNCCNDSFGLGGGGGFGGSFEKKKHGYKLEFGGGGGAGFDYNNPSNPVDPIDPPTNPGNPYNPYPGNPPSISPQPSLPPGKNNGANFGGGCGGGFNKTPNGGFNGGAGGGFGGSVGCHKDPDTNTKIYGDGYNANDPQAHPPSSIQYFNGNTFNNNQVYNTYNIHHHHHYHHHIVKSTLPASRPTVNHNKKKYDTPNTQLSSSSDSTPRNTTNGCAIGSAANPEIATNTSNSFSAAAQFTLGATVHTGFFAEQPRESEDICDVYVSLEAISHLWAQLDALILTKLQPLLTDKKAAAAVSVPQVGDTKQTSESSSSSSIISPKPIVASQRSAAAESSPSPAAQGPGTPFSPYGTPSPFAARALRKSLKGGAFEGDSTNQGPSGSSSLDEGLAPTEDENGQDASLKKIESVVGSTGTAQRSGAPPSVLGIPRPQPSGIPSRSLREDEPPRRGGEVPPRFEDEYEILGSLAAGGQGQVGTGGPMSGYGSRDLYPPGMEPGNNPFEFGGVGGLSSGGGMNPTLGDIQRMVGMPGGSDGGFGLGRNDGNNGDPSQLGRPPGARWDPTGPGYRDPFGGPGNDFI